MILRLSFHYYFKDDIIIKGGVGGIMLEISNIFGKTNEEINEMCYLFAEENNWNATKIAQNITFSFDDFHKHVKAYIKANNIKPTLEKILFFSNYRCVDNHQSFTNDKIIQFMIEEGIITSDLDQVYEKILYFCCNIKIRKGKEYCDEKGLPFDIVCKFSDLYIKSFLTIQDFYEEEIMKICYDKYEENNWNTKKIDYNLNISIEESKKYVYKYIKEKINKKPTKEQIWLLLSHTCKIIFNNYDNIVRLMLCEKVISYEQLKNPSWLTENLREYLCKFCYDKCAENNWSLTAIRIYCNQKKIKLEHIRNLGSEYVERYLPKEDRDKIVESKQLAAEQETLRAVRRRLKDNPADYVAVINNVMKAKSDKEVIDILNSYDSTLEYLKDHINTYLLYYNDNNYNREQIKNKIDIYTNYLKNKRTEANEIRKQEKHQLYIEENLDLAKQTVHQFLNGDYEKIGDFCISSGVDIKQFEKYVNIIKESDKELYNKYIGQIDNNQSKRFAVLLDKCKKIIELIKNGVEENDKRRDFDLVDYYKITSLNFEGLLNIIKGHLSAEDYRVLRIFIAKNKNDKDMTSLDVSNLYNAKIVVGGQFDAKRNIIPGTGREITKEEKQSIIMYLNKNNIRLTNKTYNIIFRRWLSGDLVINELGEEEKNNKK